MPFNTLMSAADTSVAQTQNRQALQSNFSYFYRTTSPRTVFRGLNKTEKKGFSGALI